MISVCDYYDPGETGFSREVRTILVTRTILEIRTTLEDLTIL